MVLAGNCSEVPSSAALEELECLIRTLAQALIADLVMLLPRVVQKLMDVDVRLREGP